ncbi:polysaccharide deacetylase family protein [Actinoplanes palleronii]|uniref:NodB homology domain-containing protein n=1 Tax=Actinoplanes palleronii TaxID=113570 RepID=A0ABQ4BIU4_9ACTN|nr:polysaccharide deacetylase family protein [Actinoplanes palleronii]GIE70588.1 hypothetical protein Apa02nite_066960 [Actinoplanes palleronii]
MPAEPSGTTPGGSTPEETDEATVVMPAAPLPDEPTAVISADDPTVPLVPPVPDETTAPEPADEPTVALVADETTALVVTDDTTAPIVADESTVASDEVSVPPAADEATVAFSAAEATAAASSPDDETTMLVSAAEAAPADDATVAIAATAPPADETTVVVSAAEAAALATPVDDATVAIVAAPPVADEATVAMTVTPPPDEATIAWSAPTPARTTTPAAPPARASTPARAPAPAPARLPASARASAPADEEATTWLAAGLGSAPVAPAAPVRIGGIAVSRRRLILGLSGVAGAAALTAGAVAIHGATTESSTAPGKPAPAGPAVVTSRTPEKAQVTASPVPVQRKPLSTLAEYTKAAGLPAFPSDAIALTIDDGPHPIWTPKILQLLEKYQVPAMFCMIGNQVLGHEAVAKMVTGDGHQLANHTWSHPTELGEKSKSLAQKEIHRAQKKITNTTGYVPKLFRSPGGDWSPHLLGEVAKAGLLPLDWSNDPRDWTQPGAGKIEKRMLAAKPGQILLCHDGGGDRSQTYKALSVVLPALKARGLTFVAL